MAADITKSAQHVVEALVRTAGIDAVIFSADASITVPSITDPDSASATVTVTGAAVGDIVLVVPTEALPTNCFLTGAYVTSSSTVTVVYTSIGGNVTGAAKTHNITVLSTRL